MKKILLWALGMVPVFAFAQVNIVPQPVSVQTGEGHFTLTKSTRIFFGTGTEKSAKYLQDLIKEQYHLQLKTERFVASAISNNAILFQLKAGKGVKDEYDLNVKSSGISIKGVSAEAVFYGLQSLVQLIPLEEDASSGLMIPAVSINDYPRFAYRGMHLDVSRHFFPVSFVKKYIDYLAFHKFNTFHWHLTDDQGWRIEIKRYPKLTQVGAWRNSTLIGRYPGTGQDGIRYGGFYTQEQIKEVVKYAADRYITIIPEIEMPGHAIAALASYPYLGCTKGPYKVFETWGVIDDVFCAGNDSTYKFLQNVLDEVLPLFPSKYIHVGGDECPKDRWKECPVCQQKMKANHLKDEHALQSYFVQRIEKYLNSKGRRIIGWDEILEGGLAPNATVMSWRGEEGGIAAAKQHHDVIMTPGEYVYFDHNQLKTDDSVTIGGYLPLATVYNYEPIPPVLTKAEAKYILGAQANVWTEYMAYPSKVEYMIFPRMSALSEVLWTPAAQKDYKRFQAQLPILIKRYESWKAQYNSNE